MSKEEPRNESSLSKGHQMLAASALLPVIGALSRPTQLQALVYTLFVFLYLAPLTVQDRSSSRNAEKVEKYIPPPNKLLLTAGLIGAGLVSETLLWISQLFTTQLDLRLMHPQLRADLSLAAIYYGAMALALLILLKRFSYSAREIFFIAFCITLSKQAQLGQIFDLCRRIVEDPLGAVFSLAAMFVALGSIIGLGFIAGHEPFRHPSLKLPQKISLTRFPAVKYLAALLLLFALPEIFVTTAFYIGHALHLVPEKLPVWQAPLI